MSSILTFTHVILAFTIILVVLLQEGKAGMGISFGGGSSNTVFGSSGAGNFLVKVTIVAGALFMLTSLILTKTTSHKESGSVMESVVPVQPAPVSAPPAVSSADQGKKEEQPVPVKKKEAAEPGNTADTSSGMTENAEKTTEDKK